MHYCVAVMYVRLPDDYKFGSISVAEEETAAALSSVADAVADAVQSDSPAADTMLPLQSDADDNDAAASLATSSPVAAATHRVARRSSTSHRKSPTAAAAASTHVLHSPRFQRRRTPRRRVAVTSSFITTANTDTDSGACVHSPCGTPLAVLSPCFS